MTTDNAQEFANVTREELYKLIWSTPATKLQQLTAIFPTPFFRFLAVKAMAEIGPRTSRTTTRKTSQDTFPVLENPHRCCTSIKASERIARAGAAQ
jgi:hypothetical protein